MIDPRQTTPVILGTVRAYRKLRDQGYAPDDVVTALEDVGAGSTAPPPDYAEVEEYAF